MRTFSCSDKSISLSAEYSIRSVKLVVIVAQVSSTSETIFLWSYEAVTFAICLAQHDFNSAQARSTKKSVKNKYIEWAYLD